MRGHLLARQRVRALCIYVGKRGVTQMRVGDKFGRPTYLRLGRCCPRSRTGRAQATPRRQSSRRETGSSSDPADHRIPGGAAAVPRAKPSAESHALGCSTGTRRARRLSSGRTLGTPTGRTDRRRCRRYRRGHSLDGGQTNGKSSQGHAPPVHHPATVGCRRAGGCNIYPSGAIDGG